MGWGRLGMRLGSLRCRDSRTTGPFSMKKGSTILLPVRSRRSTSSSLHTLVFSQLAGISSSGELDLPNLYQKAVQADSADAQGVTAWAAAFTWTCREAPLSGLLCSRDCLTLGPTAEHPPFGLHKQKMMLDKELPSKRRFACAAQSADQADQHLHLPPPGEDPYCSSGRQLLHQVRAWNVFKGFGFLYLCVSFLVLRSMHLRVSKAAHCATLLCLSSGNSPPEKVEPDAGHVCTVSTGCAVQSGQGQMGTAGNQRSHAHR